MHELTTSEAAIILSVLARAGEDQSSDLAQLGIPDSTFYVTRRRIYEAGWITDRYIPHSWAAGFSAVDCVLAWPGPAERSQVERDWTASQNSVLVWSGLNVLLGVFFRRDGRAPEFGDSVWVSITPSSGSIPVYFDYSRPWSRFVRTEIETGYPRSLGEPVTHTGLARTSAFSGLLDHEPAGEDASRKGHRWHSPGALPRNQRQILHSGLVQSRSLLNVDALPPYEGRTLGEIVVLSGKLRDRTSATDVLGALNNDCQVSPLLLVEDGKKLLLVALGQLGSNEAKRTKIPRAVRPVIAALSARLENIQMAIEPAESVRKLVDHRYDRIFQPSGPASPRSPL